MDDPSTYYTPLRMSRPWSPVAQPAGGATEPVAGWTAHFDASDTDNIFTTAGNPPSGVPADGNAVQQWMAESGDLAARYTNVTGESPVFRATGMNSLGCLDFDGTDDRYKFMNDAVSANKLLSDFISASEFTLVASFMLDATATNTANIYDNDVFIMDAVNQMWGMVFTTITGNHFINAYNWDGSADTVAKQLTGLSTTHVVQMRHAGGSLFISLDGGSESSVASGNTSDLTSEVELGVNVNIGNFASFRLGELFIYNTNLGASNNTLTYMTDRWL